MSSSIYSQSTAAPPAIDGGNKKDASLAEMAVKAEEDVIVDAVWGRLDDQSGPNYRNLGWCVMRHGRQLTAVGSEQLSWRSKPRSALVFSAW